MPSYRLSCCVSEANLGATDWLLLSNSDYLLSSHTQHQSNTFLAHQIGLAVPLAGHQIMRERSGVDLRASDQIEWIDFPTTAICAIESEKETSSAMTFTNLTRTRRTILHTQKNYVFHEADAGTAIQNNPNIMNRKKHPRRPIPLLLL